MNPGNEGKPAPGFATIKPARPELSARAAAPVETARAPARLPWPALGLGLLVICAAAVIFLLPRWVPAPGAAQPAPIAPPPPAAAAPAPETRSGPADAPWLRAQQMELRRQTQEILAQLLDSQKQLSARNVGNWAADEFKQAQDLAAAGDAHYGRQEFEQAHAAYTDAQRRMTQLLEKVEPLFEQSMADGNRALEQGNAAAAAAAFDVALAIDPMDRAAAAGRARADTLDQVFAVLREADRLLAEEKFEEARATYQQALDLDGATTAASAGIETAGARLRDRDFNRAMSEGFAHLDGRRLQDARRAFGRALQIKPGSREANVGLEQADAALKADRIEALLAAARSQEAAEDWSAAQASYEAALELDGALAAAIQGQKSSATRAGIHRRLEQILGKPASLYEPEFYAEVQKLHASLRAIAQPGPTLARQLAALEQALARAATPLEVRLVSDEQTRVTLYRVGDLGAFAARTLSLRPGRYVAVGTRDGFQDARVEFQVDPDAPPPTVTVRAERRVGAGS